MSLPRFSTNQSGVFLRTLNKRVNSYFKENKLRRTGNWKLYIKAVIMFALFLAPYFLILFIPMNQWLQLALAVVIGIGMAGVGMNVMHDANHGSFSTKKWVNRLMGSSLFVLAGNVYNWKVQHNILHHTFTNIHGHDEDLNAGRIIRFSRHGKWYFFHKFQHLYSILLYGLLTLNWVLTADYRQTSRYLKRKLSYGKMPSARLQWSTLIITKMLYFVMWLVIPLLVLNLAWWKVVLGFVIMHYTAGLILSMVFQLAHVVQGVDTLPTPKGSLKNSWAVHQLFTTSNFSTRKKWVHWFTGGLNHQVEHHIFPHVSHIHYKALSKIVKKTTLEFNLPYNEYKTTRKAILSHFKHLKELGKKPVLQLS